MAGKFIVSHFRRKGDFMEYAISNDPGLTGKQLSPISKVYSLPNRFVNNSDPVSIQHKSIAGRYRPVRVADGPITARYRFRRMLAGDLRSLCTPEVN